MELYEKLFYSGLTGAGELAKQTGLARPVVYDLLKKLVGIGLVLETQKSGVKMFAVQPPEKVKLLFREKQTELIAAEKSLGELKTEYHSKRAKARPRIQIYEGQKELRQMMKDMLLYRDMTVSVFWPPEKAIKLLSADFFSDFHKQRVARNIDIKVLWPECAIPSLKKYPFLETNAKLKRQVRIVPSKFNFTFGYAIYGGTVRFISLEKDYFGFIVESISLSQMMEAQFQVLWESARNFSFKK